MATTPRTRTTRRKTPAAAPEVVAEATPATEAAEPVAAPAVTETPPEPAPAAESASADTTPADTTSAATPDVTPEPPAPGADVPADEAVAPLWQVAPVSIVNLNEASEKMMKNYEDFAAYSRANADATTAAYTTLFKGMDSYTKALFSFYRGMFEMTMATTKEIMSAKSFNEVVELQNNYARNLMDGFVSEGTKLSEMGMSVANEAMVPINERVSATVETIKKSAAA